MVHCICNQRFCIFHAASAKQSTTSSDPGELLKKYYEAQKEVKNNKGSFPAAKKKKVAEGMDKIVVSVNEQ